MNKEIKFTFRPGKKGIEQILGELEKEIMSVLWEHRSVSVKDVFELLTARKKVAYTTIITVMNRLVDKNILRKQKKGKIYLYEAVISEEEYKEIISDRVVKGLMEIDGEKAIAAFVDRISDTPEELDLLEKLIEERKTRT